MIGTQARQLRDLDRWRQAGWVTAEGHAAIRQDIASRRSRIGLATSLGILAAVLIGFAAMSFVAANWDQMSKLMRLAILASGLIGSYATAGWLFQRGFDGVAHAAVLAGIAIFGASIMLIAQMYHMDGHPPDALWLWACGALAAAFALRSNSAIAAAIVLFAVWSGYEMQISRGVHWGYLPMWALSAGAVAITRWRRGLHLLAIALTGWIIFSSYSLGRWNDVTSHTIVIGIGLGLVGVSVFAGELIDRWRRISAPMLGYGMVIAFAGAFAMQFIVRTNGVSLIVMAAATLAALVATLMWAWRTENRVALWIAYAAFSIEIFALYIKKLGTLMSTSAFFLIAGLLVAALAAAALRLHQNPSDGTSEGAAS